MPTISRQVWWFGDDQHFSKLSRRCSCQRSREGEKFCLSQPITAVSLTLSEDPAFLANLAECLKPGGFVEGGHKMRCLHPDVQQPGETNQTGCVSLRGRNNLRTKYQAGAGAGKNSSIQHSAQTPCMCVKSKPQTCRLRYEQRSSALSKYNRIGGDAGRVYAGSSAWQRSFI